MTGLRVLKHDVPLFDLQFTDLTLVLFIGSCKFPIQTPGGGTWVFFEWVCAARDSKLAPRSKKTFR